MHYDAPSTRRGDEEEREKTRAEDTAVRLGRLEGGCMLHCGPLRRARELKWYMAECMQQGYGTVLQSAGGLVERFGYRRTTLEPGFIRGGS